MTWRGKAGWYISWELAAPLGKMFMLFLSTEEIWGYSLPGTKIWLASPPTQTTVGRGDKKKPLGFLSAISMPFKNTNRTYSDPTSCLFVVILYIIRTGNPPKPWTREEERVWIAPRLGGQRHWPDIFFPNLLCGTFPLLPFNIYWGSIACARLCSHYQCCGLAPSNWSNIPFWF